MTCEKLAEAIVACRNRLDEMGIAPQQYPTTELPATLTDILGHCRQMLDVMESFITADRMDPEKACRWLGFVQGCLWSCRIYTVDQLKDQNKP
jgi:hypothetical protein